MGKGTKGGGNPCKGAPPCSGATGHLCLVSQDGAQGPCRSGSQGQGPRGHQGRGQGPSRRSRARAQTSQLCLSSSSPASSATRTPSRCPEQEQRASPLSSSTAAGPAGRLGQGTSTCRGKLLTSLQGEQEDEPLTLSVQGNAEFL